MNQQTLALVKEALGARNSALEQSLNKGITQATGLVAYDLQAPALSLIPVITPLRNLIPRVRGGGGTATNWMAVTGINTGKTGLGVSEGNRGGAIATAVTQYTAPYSGIGLEDFVTFEADDASEGFQDVKATAALNLLRSVMIAEEAVILGGNRSNPLGTTPTPTLVASGTGGTIAASLTVSVIAVALTLDGYNRSSLAGGLPVAAISKTNTDGSVDTFGGGVARQSVAATIAVSAGTTNSVAATVAVVPGAAAYAWYANTGGIERLFAITTINSVVITSLPGASQLASAVAAADNSVNAMVFDGILTFAAKGATNGAYQGVMANGVAGTGTGFSTDGAGGIVEVTTALRYFWDNYRLSPDTLWCSAQELINITKKIVANGGAPLVRFTQDIGAEHSSITGGALVSAILNPITQTMLKLRIHPNLPAGTVLFTTSSIPYPMNGVGNVMQVKTRREYYQIDWPLRSRKNEFGVYADELLQVYATFSLGTISNIGNA